MPGDRTPEQVQADLAEIDSALKGKEGGDPPPLPAGEPSPEELALQREAGRHGWVPKEKYKGDPEKWKPAGQYIEEGLRFNSNIKRELQALKAQHMELMRTGQAFAKFHEESMAKKEQEIKDAITQTKRAARTAAREGDDDLAETLDQRVELLQEEQAEIKKQKDEVTVQAPRIRALNEDGTANTTDPLVEEWVQDGNEWFRDDAKLRAYSVQMGQEIIANEFGGTLPREMMGRKFLDLVSKRMAEEFPRRFTKKEDPPKRADQVGSGGNANTGGPTGHSIHDLPAEDLALMKEFISKGWTTKEKFLANYFSGEKKTHRTKS